MLLMLALGTACGTAQEAVYLSSGADTPTAMAGTPQPASDPTPSVEPEGIPAAPPDASPTPEATTAAPTSEAAGSAELALRTRRPLDGFDLHPPDGFDALEYYPLHGKSMVIDGRRVGIRFFGKHGTGQSVLVSVFSESAAEATAALERYQAHTGDVQVGRPVRGASAVWELRERSAPGRSTRTGLSVYLPDGTGIAVNGTNIEDVSALYEFLIRIEDAPDSMEPMPADPGEAMSGGGER